MCCNHSLFNATSGTRGGSGCRHCSGNDGIVVINGEILFNSRSGGTCSSCSSCGSRNCHSCENNDSREGFAFVNGEFFTVNARGCNGSCGVDGDFAFIDGEFFTFSSRGGTCNSCNSCGCNNCCRSNCCRRGCCRCNCNCGG